MKPRPDAARSSSNDELLDAAFAPPPPAAMPQREAELRRTAAQLELARRLDEANRERALLHKLLEERQRAEPASEEARTQLADQRSLNRRLDLALQAGRLGTFEYDLTTGTGTWDRRAWEIFGLDPAEGAPAPSEIEKLLVPSDAPAWRHVFTAGHARTPARSAQIKIALPSGKIRSIACRALHQDESEGGIPRLTGVLEDITDRLASEAQHRDALQLYNTIFNSVAEGLTLQRADDRIIDCNPAAESILGLTRNQLLGLDSFNPRWRAVDARGEPLAPSDHPSVTVVRTRRPVRGFEMGVIRADGSRVHLIVNAEPIRDPSGHITHVIASFSDVTAQRISEAEMKRADERLRAAVAASRIVWWEWAVDRDSFRVIANGDLCILGYAPQQLASVTGKAGWLGLTHPEDRPRVEATLDEVLSGRVVEWRADHRLRAAEGGWKWVRNVGRVNARSADGTPTQMIGTTQDIHADYETEQRLESSARRLQMALGASRMAIWRVNIQTGESELDDRAADLFGTSARETRLSYETMLAAIVEEDHSKVDAVRDAVRSGKGQFECTCRLRRPDGTIRHIRTLGTLQRDGNDRPEWVTGISEDISDRVEADLKRRDLESQLAQSQRLETLGTLAGGIAHDFNNILTGLIGFVELSLDALPPGNTASDLLLEARQCGLRARDLVKRLLLFSRRAPDSFRRPLQLEQLVAESNRLIGATLPTSIEIVTRIPSDLPPVEADPSQIQQVLMNLCVNAAQAIGSKQGRLEISVRHECLGADSGLSCPPGSYVCLTVTDNGCGMDEATQIRIFDPFFTTKPIGEGTGLGLAMVHGIVLSHGGAIRTRSAPGAGTTFEVYLPECAGAEADQSAGTTHPFPIDGRQRTVLLADDEETVRVVVSTVLERADFRVEASAEGDTALARFQRQPMKYAVAVLDLSMPGKTGHELIRSMRMLRPDIPVVLMSGDHQRYGAQQEMTDHGRIELLAKPFSGDELLAAIGRALPLPA